MALPKPLTKPLPRTLYEPRTFTYRDLLAMERAGILGENERVELLHGSIVPMTVNPPHAQVVRELTKTLSLAFLSVAEVDVQNPLRLSTDLDDRQLPIPDLMLLARRDYDDHPQPEDVILLIEVSDTTLLKDRQVKLPLYAGAGIEEVWVFNLADKHLEVYTEPQGDMYRTRRTLELSEEVAPRRFPEQAQVWLSESVVARLP